MSGAVALIAAPGSLAASGPSRLVTLDWTATEIALSLGISPAGCAEISGYRTWV
ncbi:MAG: iron compound ABC transporter substrate-binding protein, partial [Rhizobium sp.]